jgi:nucleotide-binding universal stress UspA family protein
MLNHILVPLDGSVLAECVLSHAATLAQIQVESMQEPQLMLTRALEHVLDYDPSAGMPLCSRRELS